MNAILQYLKNHGESIDTDIAQATGLPIITVHQHLAELKAKHEIMVCHATRYQDDEKYEVMICRLVGQGPVIKPGRKARPQVVLT